MSSQMLSSHLLRFDRDGYASPCDLRSLPFRQKVGAINRFQCIAEAGKDFARGQVVCWRMHFADYRGVLGTEEFFGAAQGFDFGAFDITLYRIGPWSALSIIIERYATLGCSRRPAFGGYEFAGAVIGRSR